MILEGNTVVSGCGSREYQDTLAEAEAFASRLALI
jgi:hypothetical protein